MNITELLVERVVNAMDPATKQKYAEPVWDLLQTSYAKVPGGFGTAASVDELIDKSGLWKLITRDGKITAVGIYRDQNGRKSIAAGTDGTPQGKKDYMMIKNADVKMKRAWGEVSGSPEKILARSGAKAVPSKFAPMLTKKQILDYNPDGYHYTRLINGEPHEKIIYGIIQLSPELEAELTAAGIKLHELPANFSKVG